MAALHAAKVVAHREEVVAVMSVLLSAARRHVTAKVHIVQAKVHKILLLSRQPVVVKSDELYGEDLGQLYNVKFFHEVTLLFALRTSVRDTFRLQVVLDALVQ